MPRFFVHLGYPKTGTTLLQRHLYPRHPEIDYLGKSYPDYVFRTPELGRALAEIVSLDSLRYPGHARAAAEIDRLRASSARPCLVISHESFLHVAAADPGLVADRVCEALRPDGVLITLRNQSSLIRSFYDRHGRFGQYTFHTPGENEMLRPPLSFADWFANCRASPDRNILSTLHYADVVGAYLDRLGHDRVLVQLHETLAGAPGEFLSRQASFLGVDADQAVALVGDRREHVGFGPAEAFVQTRVRPIARRIGLGPAVAPLVRAAARTDRRRTRIEIDPADQEWIDTTYRDGNRRLATRLGLPLDEHGYAT